MAYNVRKVPDAMIFAMVAAHNARQLALVSTNFHADKTQVNTGEYMDPVVANDTVTAATATNAATSLTLVNQLKAVVDRHFADTYAHDTAVSAALTIATATDTTSAITLANDIKAKYNIHLSASNVHFTNDATNDVTNADATDAATLTTVLNELKGDVNAHITSAPGGSMIRLVDA